VSAEPNGFIELGLAPELVQAVADLGYTQPTAVQRKAIPLAMGAQAQGGRYIDLMVSSQTGSGKTAAFLLPVLHTLLTRRPRPTPRREFDRLAAEAAARGERPQARPPQEPHPTAQLQARRSRRTGAVPHT
jgi:superfamily II DNA/RNA helicase